jgi:ubiquinone/menaquinone biosynthesis C-methylase UbiE
MKILELDGNEKILDLGTGSGFLAVNIAKHIKKGNVIGIDKYYKKKRPLIQFIKNIIKINYVFNSLSIAKRNAIIEQVQNKCWFLTYDLEKLLPFDNNSFDVILASEFFYCFPIQKQQQLLREIHRILKNNGQFLILETKSIPIHGWNVKKLEKYMNEKTYVRQSIIQNDKIILHFKKIISKNIV